MARQINRSWNKGRIYISNKDTQSSNQSPPLIPPPPPPLTPFVPSHPPLPPPPTEWDGNSQGKWEHSAFTICEEEPCENTWAKSEDRDRGREFKFPTPDGQLLRFRESGDVGLAHRSSKPVRQQIHIVASVQENPKDDKFKKLLKNVKDGIHHSQPPPPPPRLDFPVETGTKKHEYRRVDEYNEDPRLRAELYPLEEELAREEVQGTYRQVPETIEILPERNTIEQEASEMNLVPTQKLKEDQRINKDKNRPVKTDAYPGTSHRDPGTKIADHEYLQEKLHKDEPRKKELKVDRAIMSQGQAKKEQITVENRKAELGKSNKPGVSERESHHIARKRSSSEGTGGRRGMVREISSSEITDPKDEWRTPAGGGRPSAENTRDTHAEPQFRRGSFPRRNPDRGGPAEHIIERNLPNAKRGGNRRTAEDTQSISERRTAHYREEGDSEENMVNRVYDEIEQRVPKLPLHHEENALGYPHDHLRRDIQRENERGLVERNASADQFRTINGARTGDYREQLLERGNISIVDDREPLVGRKSKPADHREPTIGRRNMQVNDFTALNVDYPEDQRDIRRLQTSGLRDQQEIRTNTPVDETFRDRGGAGISDFRTRQWGRRTGTTDDVGGRRNMPITEPHIDLQHRPVYDARELIWNRRSTPIDDIRDRPLNRASLVHDMRGQPIVTGRYTDHLRDRPVYREEEIIERMGPADDIPLHLPPVDHLRDRPIGMRNTTVESDRNQETDRRNPLTDNVQNHFFGIDRRIEDFDRNTRMDDIRDQHLDEISGEIGDPDYLLLGRPMEGNLQRDQLRERPMDRRSNGMHDLHDRTLDRRLRENLRGADLRHMDRSEIYDMEQNSISRRMEGDERNMRRDDIRGRPTSRMISGVDDHVSDRRIGMDRITHKDNFEDHSRGRNTNVDDFGELEVEGRGVAAGDIRGTVLERINDHSERRGRPSRTEGAGEEERHKDKWRSPDGDRTEGRIDRQEALIGDALGVSLEARNAQNENMRRPSHDKQGHYGKNVNEIVGEYDKNEEEHVSRRLTPPYGNIKGSTDGAFEKRSGYGESKHQGTPYEAEKENKKEVPGDVIQPKPSFLKTTGMDSLRRRSGGDVVKSIGNGRKPSHPYEVLVEEPDEISIEKRDSVMLPGLEESEKEFHELVATGNVSDVRLFLNNHPGFNINCVNYQKISALHVAVHEQNEGMVEFLLQQPALDCSDCALYAIKEGNVRIVEKIMDKIRETSPGLEFAATTHSVDFPDDMTPIILAAQLGNYEIIDFLIKREHIIPPVHNPYCKCEACKADLQKYDRLKYSTMKLNLYKAICNPMYIFHVTDDPFQRAFDLTQELQDAAKVFPQFKSSYEELWRDLRNFTVDLIGCCRNAQEVEIILKKSANNIAGSITFPRLQYAIDLKQKEFVSHPYTQAVLVDAWTGDLLEWKVRSPLMQALSVFPRIPMLPLMAIMCMFLPNHKLVKKWKTPVNKMISSVASYLIFLIILFLESNLDKSNQKRGPPNSGLESFIILYVIGYIWLNIRVCFRLGPKRFFSTMWHWYDCIMLFLFTMTIIFWIASLADITANDEIDLPRKYWNALDPELIAEGFFAAAVTMAFFRLNMFLSLNYHLGPLQVSIGKMTLDIFRFIIIFFIIIIAWCAGLCRFYQPYEGMIQKDPASGSSTTQVSSFVSFSMTLKTFFWAIFGMSPIESADVVIENLPGDTPDTTIINHHEFTEAVGYIAFALFQFLSVVVVLNMLVACMANTFTKVIDNVTVEWVFGRSQIYLNFMAASTLPPPFNLLPTAAGIKSTFLWLKLLAKPSNGQRAKCNISHCCYIESETEEYVNNEFPSLMSELAQRYLRLKGESVETHDDLEELKCEMKELLRKMDKIIMMRRSII